MSATQLTCPICDAVLQLSAAPTPGAHTKCPRCGTPFSLDSAATPAPPVRERRPEPAAPAIRQPPVRRPVADFDSVEELPLARAGDAARPGGMSLLLIAGISGAGVAALAALALIVGLFIWGLNRGTNNVQAARPDEPVRPVIDDHAKEPPRTEPARITRPNPEPTSPGDSALPVEVLRRVKAATLYVKVTAADGRQGTGSGFFEQSTGLILTNAHVVGMLREGTRPPRKIEVVLNSGTDDEKLLPGELVSVDRDADLALVRVQLSTAQAEATPRLTVASANELLETQPVYVAGFPFGEEINRGVTISATSVSSMHKGPDGTLSKVQVNGGMHPGNSGGPVIDGHGNVIGVAVSGIPGTQINFAVPGEAVQAFIGGRLAEVQVSTDAILRNGKVIVPVQILALDPRKRITRVALDYWTGPERATPLPPSDRPAKLGNLTTPRQTVQVTYDSERSEGRAEIVLDAIPARGMQLWVQPVLTSGGNEAAWLAGTSYNLSPPVEEKPAVLVAKPRVGKGPVLLTTTSRFKFESRAGKDQAFLQTTQARLNDQTLSVGAEGARGRLTVEKFDLGVTINGTRADTTDRFQTAIHKDIVTLGIDYRADTKGNLTTKKTDLTRVPAASREILQGIAEQLQQGFDILAIPQPGEVKPGDTWQAKRELPLDMPDSFQTALLNVTFTYRGLREHDGRPVAVVELRGTLVGDRGNETLAAKMTGSALIDQATGVVVQAKAVTDAALTIRQRKETIYASGTLEVGLSRDLDAK